MISEKIGTALKKNTKTKIWWIKSGLALMVSNVFFFLLFSGDPEVKQDLPTGTPEGWVEVQLNAELMTPFHSGKKVLIIHRVGRKKLEGVLQNPGIEQVGKITVLVKENEAHALFQHETWEVLPYLKNLTFVSVRKGESHEIRY
jgi:hypothetical protein